MSFESAHQDPASELRAVFHDDGKTAYLYLQGAEGKIVADVWVYNRVPAPTIPEWKDPSIPEPRARMPFANPAGFASERAMEPVARQEDLRFEWHGPEVTLSVRGETIARLAPGMKPGHCKLAIKNGPLAKVFP